MTRMIELYKLFPNYALISRNLREEYVLNEGSSLFHLLHVGKSVAEAMKHE